MASNRMHLKGLLSKNIIIMTIFGILVFAALGTAVYFYLQYQKSQELLKNPASNTQEEVKSLVAEVGKLMVLPQSEVPQVAVVSDVEKLKGQSFFTQAKNGDKVIIYTKNQKAILYDPVQKKIKEVGPINLTQPTPSAEPTPAVLQISLYNGTTTSGLTTKVEQQLKKTMPNIVVVEKDNASKSTYVKTIIVDVTKKNATSTQKLATELGGEVGSLPEGEISPANTDIIVILGKE